MWLAGRGSATRGSRRRHAILLRRLRLNLKTTTRTLCALAAFVNRGAHEFLDETLHGATHRGVFPGQGRERASLTADDVPTVLLDVSHGAELFVEQFARGMHGTEAYPGTNGRECTGEVFSRPLSERMTSRQALANSRRLMSNDIRPRQHARLSVSKVRDGLFSRPLTHTSDNAVPSCVIVPVPRWHGAPAGPQSRRPSRVARRRCDPPAPYRVAVSTCCPRRALLTCRVTPASSRPNTKHVRPLSASSTGPALTRQNPGGERPLICSTQDYIVYHLII